MRICLLGGTGYVGLITGVGLAELGHRVVNVDIDEMRVSELQAGKTSIYEEGLEPLLRRNLDAGRLRFTTDIPQGVDQSEIVFIAVGTPSQTDGHADLSQVIQVAEEIVLQVNEYKIIVVKSTVPVGTVELVGSILKREKKEGVDFDIVANPEFLREGKGIYDFFYPDRIVIGSRSQLAAQRMKELYAPILSGKVPPLPIEGPTSAPSHGSHGTGGQVPLVETDIASAQMIKYAANAFLATRVSFINEVGGLCERLGADVKEVARGIGYDPRIGHSYLEAGIGFGGPCLEKDLQALIRIAEANSYEPRLLRATHERNEHQVQEVIARVKGLTGNLLYNKHVAIFGLSFKAGTNDVRNSLAVRVLDQLASEGAVVRAYDPVAIPEAKTLRPNVAYCEDPYDAVAQAEALLILTDWPEFRELDYQAIKARMAAPCIVDGRNLLDPLEMRGMGFRYWGPGRLGPKE